MISMVDDGIVPFGLPANTTGSAFPAPVARWVCEKASPGDVLDDLRR
jgi:hypothetical protein